MNAIAAPAHSDPLAQLWTTAFKLLTEMIRLFGAPTTLIAKLRLDQSLRRQLTPWVRSLEELVRKLLLAEAAACAQHAPAPPRASSTFARLERTRAAARTPAPTRLSARFNLTIPRDERIVPDNRAPRIRALWDQPTVLAPTRVVRAKQQPGADRLALRFEALRRVIEKHAAYARRLLNRIARLAHDLRARAALRFALRGPAHVAPGFGDPLRDAGRLAIASVETLANTS